MHSFFFNHSSVDEHLDCLHALTIVNRAAMNIPGNISFSSMFFSEYMSRSRIIGSHGIKVGVEFSQKIFYIIKMIVVFINHLFDAENHIVLFVNIEKPFHPWNKSHLLILYDPPNELERVSFHSNPK